MVLLPLRQLEVVPICLAARNAISVGNVYCVLCCALVEQFFSGLLLA